MADKIEETIREIAAKHGIALGRDDPILILQTLNEMLMRDTVVAQQEILDRFKEELEEIAFRWGEDAKNKAERTLNATLIAIRSEIHYYIQSATETASSSTEEELQSIVVEIKQATNRFIKAAFINLLAVISPTMVIFIIYFL